MDFKQNLFQVQIKAYLYRNLNIPFEIPIVLKNYDQPHIKECLPPFKAKK